MSVWGDVVGQPEALAVLAKAVADPTAMTHAWLFTGPPGSGRSVAARAFAAALQCATGDGCGHCQECTQALAGAHPDVALIVPEGLSIGVKDARRIILRSAHAPTRGRWSAGPARRRAARPLARRSEI